jgi:hypothetical protein
MDVEQNSLAFSGSIELPVFYCVIPSEPSLNLSLRGARQCDEAIFWFRRLLRPCGARNDIWYVSFRASPSTLLGTFGSASEESLR